MKSNTFSTGKMVRLAVLVAILIIMGFTPLGYLKVGAVSITFNMIPVVIGAIIVGPAGGAILGVVFGLTSFAQCLGAEVFGTALLSVNPLFTFILCVLPRFLAGWLPGLIFKAFSKTKLDPIFGGFVTCLAGSIFNTVFFTSALWILFGAEATAQLNKIMENIGAPALDAGFFALAAFLITVNAVFEAAVSTVIGGGIARALLRYIPVKHLKSVKNEG